MLLSCGKDRSRKIAVNWEFERKWNEEGIRVESTMGRHAETGESAARKTLESTFADHFRGKREGKVFPVERRRIRRGPIKGG